jgi:hypothetical protein
LEQGVWERVVTGGRQVLDLPQSFGFGVGTVGTVNELTTTCAARKGARELLV